MQYSSDQQMRGAERTTLRLWLGPLLYMVIVGLYFLLRYSSNWAEADSATFTAVIRAFAQGERLAASSRNVYPNGYAFQAISTYLLTVTGVDVTTLQQLVYPMLACLVVLPAWVAYRELTGSGRGATLTTILLFTQPEFLFVILRSSHEKFTRSLFLLCLFFLTRNLKLTSQPRLFAANVVLFYITLFAFITTNNLLAHSFIVAIFTAILLGRLLETRNPYLAEDRGKAYQRFQYIPLIGFGLVYLVTFFIYPPAKHDLQVMQSMWERVQALLLDVQASGGRQEATNPYTHLLGWRSLPVYFMVSIANWIVLGVSFGIWVRQGVRWLWHGQSPRTRAAWFVWLLYAAFAIQAVLAVLSDVSGSLGSNLQHRLFPSLAMIAVVMVGSAIDQWRPRRFARPLQLGLAVAVCFVAILSVFKATNEPVFSNKWTFYQPAELAALSWTDAHLEHANIWTEYDERLAVAFVTNSGESVNDNVFQGYGVRFITRHILMTPITRLRSSRLGVPLPVPADALRIYDNGGAELYQRRPETPFQK